MPELPENQYVSPFHRAPKRATSPEGPSGRTSVQFKANSKAAARRTSPADIFDFSKRRNGRNTQIDRGTDHDNAKTSEDLRRPPKTSGANERACGLPRPKGLLARVKKTLANPAAPTLDAAPPLAVGARPRGAISSMSSVAATKPVSAAMPPEIIRIKNTGCARARGNSSSKIRSPNHSMESALAKLDTGAFISAQI